MGVIASFIVGPQQPSWTCYVDGKSLPPVNTTNFVNINYIEICSSNDIVRPPGATSSNLTVVASGNTTSDPLAPFLFDYIQYEPDATVILDNLTLAVDAFDGDITYSSGWTQLTTTGVGFETSVQGSSLNFDFVGAFRL